MPTGQFRPLAPLDFFVIGDGQSRQRSPDETYTPYIALRELTGWAGLANEAINGTSITNLTPTQAVRIGRHIRPEYGTIVLDFVGGETDLGEDPTGQAVYDQLLVYITAARALGVDRVVVGTTLPSGAFLATTNVKRLEYNELIRTDGPNHFDAIVDYDVGFMSAPGVVFGQTRGYIFDATHQSRLGAQFCAGLKRDGIVAALAA